MADTQTDNKDQNKQDQKQEDDQKLNPQDLKTHNELTQTLHTLDLLNSQLGVAGSLLVNQYHVQKQKEAVTAQRQQMAAANVPMQQPYPGMYGQPNQMPAGQPAPMPQPAYGQPQVNQPQYQAPQGYNPQAGMQQQSQPNQSAPQANNNQNANPNSNQQGGN